MGGQLCPSCQSGYRSGYFQAMNYSLEVSEADIVALIYEAIAPFFGGWFFVQALEPCFIKK